MLKVPEGIRASDIINKKCKEILEDYLNAVPSEAARILLLTSNSHLHEIANYFFTCGAIFGMTGKVEKLHR